MPTCEVCGRECRSTQEITLEGADLRVCDRCAKLGEPVRRPKSTGFTPRPGTKHFRSSTPSRRSTHRPKSSRPRAQQRELVPVEDFTRKIRISREAQGMSQQDVARILNERASVIGKLESGKMSPTIQIARKLERLFKLELLEEAASVDLPRESSSRSTTLGDVVQIRRKKPPS